MSLRSIFTVRPGRDVPLDDISELFREAAVARYYWVDQMKENELRETQLAGRVWELLFPSTDMDER
jgi:hypothetical protein